MRFGGSPCVLFCESAFKGRPECGCLLHLSSCAPNLRASMGFVKGKTRTAAIGQSHPSSNCRKIGSLAASGAPPPICTRTSDFASRAASSIQFPWIPSHNYAHNRKKVARCFLDDCCEQKLSLVWNLHCCWCKCVTCDNAISQQSKVGPV